MSWILGFKTKKPAKHRGSAMKKEETLLNLKVLDGALKVNSAPILYHAIIHNLLKVQEGC